MLWKILKYFLGMDELKLGGEGGYLELETRDSR